MPKRVRVWTAMALLVLTTRVLAADIAVPPDLQAWRGWVLQDEEFRRCPYIAGTQATDAAAFQCAWPERLVLDLDGKGGRFAQRWELFAETWIGLPGDLEHWPHDVQVDATRAVVVLRNGTPQVRLSAGSHAISGSFRWARRPESLAVPAQAGIIALALEGQAIAQPEKSGNSVWLGQRRGAVEPQQLELQVYRLLNDGIPAVLTTLIRVRAAGDAREELLAPVLPKGFVPMQLSGELPAKLEPDGRLRVQVRAGAWEIRLAARGSEVAQVLRRPKVEGPWVSDEIWSFEGMDRLRVAAVEGVESIDPGQANVPEEWHEYPSYRVGPESEFKVVERSRGLPVNDDNQLTLERVLWYDFAHHGFTAVDSIGGQMRQGWRLEMGQPYHLLSARIGEQNLLVIEGNKGATGIELRAPNVAVQAVSRIDERSAIPATGWQSRFTQVHGVLHLPPGHRLLAAVGADNAPGAWLERWRLLDMFLVLIVSLAVMRLMGWQFGLLALGGLALTQHDSNGMIWLWVNLLVALVLAREAPEGRLRRLASAYRAVSVALLVITLVPFTASQARLAIYPQLDAAYYGLDGPASGRLAKKLGAPSSQTVPAAPESAALMEDKARGIEGVSVTANMKLARVLQRYAPGTVLQAGPGIPNWQFISHDFSWAGPVEAGQKLRFVIATPFWLSLWRVFGIVFLAALLIALFRFAYGWPRNWPRLPRFGQAAAIGVLGFGGFLASVQSRADIPDTALLNELKARLTRVPECAPSCLEITAARVDANPRSLDIELDVSALTAVAVPIPQAAGRWEPEAISVDGEANGGLFRDTSQQLWVPLRSGAHVVRLSGRIVAAESVQLVFPRPPRTIVAHGEGWEISGVSDERLLTNSLELARKVAAGPAARLEASLQFAPFVRVTRHLHLDLDWTIETNVERLAPEKGAFTVKIPLLEGESVLSDLEVTPDRNALVAMSAGESNVAWSSGLARADKVTLKSSSDPAHAEVWSFDVSPEWNVQFEGTPVVLPEDVDTDNWTFEFHPRSGEQLTVNITRPEAAQGATLAIDGVTTDVRVGKRSTDTSLSLFYRSTQGGRHVLRIPPDARVTAVTVNDQNVPIRPEKGELAIALLPGSHHLQVNWQSDAGIGVRTRAPHVDLASPSSNVLTQLSIPADRWVLFAMGPGVGPAILYWGELIVFIVVAALLGRSSRSPLRTQEWLLLGLGLSTFSWSVLLLFTAWIFAMKWRSGWQGAVNRRNFNLVQVGLGLLSVVALISLLSAIPYGLLSTPDMRVRGLGSSAAMFTWFLDQAPGPLPQPSVISVSLWWYKLAMLAWALWLSFALLRWLPWSWRAFATAGLWRGQIAGSGRPATPKPGPGFDVNPG